jgi:hypothetical protein
MTFDDTKIESDQGKYVTQKSTMTTNLSTNVLFFNFKKT